MFCYKIRFFFPSSGRLIFSVFYVRRTVARWSFDQRFLKLPLELRSERYRIVFRFCFFLERTFATFAIVAHTLLLPSSFLN